MDFEITLAREIRKNYSPGKLYRNFDNMFLAFTLEDPYRYGVKIPGDTCIPFGKYEMDWYDSRKFGRVLMLKDVPNFDFIEIHYGNSTKDTKGCILPGLFRTGGFIYRSRAALEIVNHECVLGLQMARFIHPNAKMYINIVSAGESLYHNYEVVD